MAHIQYFTDAIGVIKHSVIFEHSKQGFSFFLCQGYHVNIKLLHRNLELLYKSFDVSLALFLERSPENVMSMSIRSFQLIRLLPALMKR